MKRLKSYFFTNANLNSRGKYISLKDNAEPNETLFSDLLDSVVKPKVGSDYQDQADYNAVNSKDSTKFTTAENLPEVDTTGSLLTITTTAAVDTNLLRRKKYTVAVNTPVNTSDISSRVSSKLVTPANLPKFALDNSLYSQQDSQVSYYDNPITETTDAGLFTIYKLKLKALTSEMMTHSGVKLNTILNTLRTDVDACVSDAELASAVSTLNTALGLKANKVTPTFVTGYNGTKVAVNSQGVVTQVDKAKASDIGNDSSVSGSTVKDALNWLKANGGGGTGGASDTDGITNLSDVSGGTATDAFNTLLEATQQYFVKDVIGKTNGDTLEVDKINVLNLTSSTTFTLPTASIAYKGKVLIVVQSNAGNYKAVLAGAAQGPLTISDFRDVIVFNCVYNGTGYDWFAISKDDSKMCSNEVVISASTYTASANDNIKADAQSLGSDINITIPTAGVAGRMIYTYYPTGSPSAYVVNLIGGYSATLNQLDWFLLRDNGSYWEAIGTSQNTVDLSAYATLASPTFTGTPSGPTATSGTNTTQLATTAFVTSAIAAIPAPSIPTLASVTGAGNTTTNAITIGGLVVNYPSGSGVAASITKGGNGEALTVNKTSGSGNVASFTGGKTLISELDLTTPLADAEIASASTWNGKFNTPTGLTTNTVSRWNGTGYENSYITEDTATTCTKPYPTVNTIPSGGGTPSASGGLRWFDNLASVSDLYIYKKYAVGSNPAGWYRIIDSQNPTFPSLTVSGAEIYTNYITGTDGWRNLSTLYSGKTASIMPTKFVGQSSPANSRNTNGIMMYDSSPNYSFLKSYDALEWKWLGAPNNGFILDYLGMQLGNGVSRGDSNIGFTSDAKYLVKMFSGQNVSPSITLTAIITVNGNNVTNIRMLQESSDASLLNLTVSANKALITAVGTFGCDYFVRKLTSLYGGVAPTYEEKMFFSSDINEFRWEGTKGFALGTSTINASAQLDLQATNKGLGLNLVAGNLGTTRNGLIWYDTIANQFEGVQNGVVVNLLSGSGLTTNRLTKWSGSGLVDSLILSRAGGITLQNSTVIDLQTENKSYFEFYPLLRNTGGTPRFALDLFPETSTQFAGFVSSVINITSGGDVVSGKNTVMNGITATHRSTDGTNGNRPFVNINAIMVRPSVLAVGNSNSGVHHITSQNADNYTSIVQDGTSGSSPVHYSAFSQRSDGVGFSHTKSVSASSGVQSRHNFNQLNTTQTTWTNGFGFNIRNTLANNNASPQIVNFTEEYIIQNQGAGTVHAGKRYRYEAGNQSAASAHIMGIYRTGVIIGDTTALPNALCSLDLDSATTGLGLNRVAGDLGTTRNGLMWYDTTNNRLRTVIGGVVTTVARDGDAYRFDECFQLTDMDSTYATANQALFQKFVPKSNITITKIFYYATLVGTDTVRVAIFADSANAPTTIAVQGSEATTGATTLGLRNITVSSTTLIAGTTYWLAIKCEGGTVNYGARTGISNPSAPIVREVFVPTGAFSVSPSTSGTTMTGYLAVGV